MHIRVSQAISAVSLPDSSVPGSHVQGALLAPDQAIEQTCWTAINLNCF
jgi:hypothetical protein